MQSVAVTWMETLWQMATYVFGTLVVFWYIQIVADRKRDEYWSIRRMLKGIMNKYGIDDLEQQ